MDVFILEQFFFHRKPTEETTKLNKHDDDVAQFLTFALVLINQHVQSSYFVFCRAQSHANIARIFFSQSFSVHLGVCVFGHFRLQR